MLTVIYHQRAVDQRHAFHTRPTPVALFFKVEFASGILKLLSIVVSPFLFSGHECYKVC